MILSFNIEYRTNWGEEVRIAGLSPESVPLHTTDGIYWTAELEFRSSQRRIDNSLQLPDRTERNCDPQRMGQFFPMSFPVRYLQEEI